MTKSFAGSYWHTYKSTSTYTDGPGRSITITTTWADHTLDDPNTTECPRVVNRQRISVELSAPGLTYASYDEFLQWLIDGVTSRPMPKLEWKTA